MARKFISYNGRIVSDNLTLKLLGQDVSSGSQCGDTPFTNTKSIEFDGTNDYVIANVDGTSSGGVLASSNTDVEVTISLWFKIPSLPSTDRGLFQWSNTLTSIFPFLLFQIRTTGLFRVYVNNGYRFSQSININTWYNIVLIRTASTNTWTLYLNGSPVSTYNDGGSLIYRGNASSIYLGNGYNGYINGYIDEVAIFNSELSASDVTTIYNGGIPNDLCILNPLSWWRMGDGDTFPTLTDNGSGGNDGTMTNMSSGNIVEDVPPSDWTPTNVNTVAWIDASDTGSYTTAGSTLTSVTDKAGTYTMNIGNTPTVVTGGLNSLNVFDFDGNGEYLQSSTYSNQTSSGNHWAVGVFLADFVDGDKDSFWSYETNQSPKRDYAVSSAGGGSNSWPGELDLDALSSNRISSTIGNKQDWNLQSVSIDSWVIVSGWFNKTGNQIGNRVNGNNAYTPVNDYDNSISPNQELRLMRNRASQELDGRLAEFFAVADLPGTGGTDLTDLEKAEGYLAWKWGLEGNLPVSHPYKNSPPTV